jgi:hypothetical protein
MCYQEEIVPEDAFDRRLVFVPLGPDHEDWIMEAVRALVGSRSLDSLIHDVKERH